MFTLEEKKVLAHAASIIESKIKKTDAFTSPNLVKDYCQNTLAHYEQEVFQVLHLDNKNRLIESTPMFYGTIDSASVYPREVVKAALLKNSAALILVHCHPSGDPTPSEADKRITRRLKEALSLIDVRVLDHIVVGVEGCYSFADHGQI